MTAPLGRPPESYFAGKGGKQADILLAQSGAPTAAQRDYSDRNLIALDEWQRAYEEWWNSGFGLFKTLKQMANPDPDTMRAEYINKMVAAGMLRPGMAPPKPLDWSVKVALVSGSVIAFIIVLVWALSKAK